MRGNGQSPHRLDGPRSDNRTKLRRRRGPTPQQDLQGGHCAAGWCATGGGKNDRESPEIHRPARGDAGCCFPQLRAIGRRRAPRARRGRHRRGAAGRRCRRHERRHQRERDESLQLRGLRALHADLPGNLRRGGLAHGLPVGARARCQRGRAAGPPRPHRPRGRRRERDARSDGAGCARPDGGWLARPGDQGHSGCRAAARSPQVQRPRPARAGRQQQPAQHRDPRPRLVHRQR